MKDLELLATYPTEFEAELVRSKLGARGIEAMLEAQDRSNVLPMIDFSNGFHLYVELEDLERAKSIINDENDDLMEDMEEA